MIFDSAVEERLAKCEIELEAERRHVETLLAECARDKVQPAKDYWHKLHRLTQQVNTLRRLLETSL